MTTNKAEKSTIYDLGGHLTEIGHAVPYFVGVFSPKPGIVEIFYASASNNGAFRNEKGWILPQQIQYTSLDDLYIESAAQEGDREAFRHLLNVQRVALRAISDGKEMLKSNSITQSEFEYVHKYLTELIYKSHDVLVMHKDLLQREGVDVTGWACSTTQMSKYSQKARLANGMIHLIKTGVLQRGDNTNKTADKAV